MSNPFKVIVAESSLFPEQANLSLEDNLTSHTDTWIQTEILVTMIVATVIGGYIITSFILFKFPNLLYRKKNLKFVCHHISHRGGAGENLENTMTAFEHAVHHGTDMLEIDLQLTHDGEVVISHDNNLFRTAGLDINISDLDYKDLPELKPAIPVDFAGGKLCQGGKDRRIPLLKEVFEKFPDLPINIDIKVNNDRLIKKVNDLIKEYKREETTVWGNFNIIVTNKCYKMNPDVPLFFSARKVVFLVLFTYTGLLPFIPFQERCLELLMPCVTFRNPGFEEARKKKQVLWFLWLMDKLLMRRAIFEHLQKRGIQTYLWVLNEEEDFQKAFQLGVTGVMTDYPSKLKAFLDANPTMYQHTAHS